MLNHTGCTYSHSCMIDFPRCPFSELHLGTFPDSTEFQSWKVNFKTEVCSKTAYLHLTMRWIKEVEIAKSIGELVTSRSIVGRTDFTDFDMLDAMIASANKRLLDKHIHFRKIVSVEEQRAQKHDRFLRGRKIPCNWSSTSGARPISFVKISLQNEDVQDFDVRWDQALLSASEMPSGVILEGLYKKKFQDTVQLQTVLASYDQETVRNNGQTSYSRLKMSVKLHVDLIM